MTKDLTEKFSVNDEVVIPAGVYSCYDRDNERTTFEENKTAKVIWVSENNDLLLVDVSDYSILLQYKSSDIKKV